MVNDLQNTVSFFQNAPDSLLNEFERVAVLKKIPQGQFIAMEGDNCNYLPIIKSGKVRVYKNSANGNEMTLYRILPGESCILTMSCLVSCKSFPAIAFTESDSEVYLIDSETIRKWIEKFPLWRDYVLDYMSSVILKVLTLLESNTFDRTEKRVVDYLLENSKITGDSLKITHQKIASELGTAREVVSRILKEFESNHVIKLSRGTITILNRARLKSDSVI